MVSIIWFPKTRNPDKEYESGWIKAFRAFPMGLFFVFGVIFMDIFIEVVVLQSYPIATWTQTFPSAILSGIIGFEYIMMAIFVAPNKRMLFTSIGYIISYLLYTRIYLPIAGTADDVFIGNLLFVFVIIFIFYMIHLLVFSIDQVVKKFKRDYNGDARIWNIRPWFKKTFNVKVNIILFILITTEAMLSFIGYSLITIFVGPW